jgi:hypothetical protein
MFMVSPVKVKTETVFWVTVKVEVVLRVVALEKAAPSADL